MKKSFRILSIDPGTMKWGGVVMTPEDDILKRGIFPVENLLFYCRQWILEFQVQKIVLGNATNSKFFLNSLKELGLPVFVVDEKNSTLEARKLYFQHFPPRGIYRLLPLGMQTPPQEYDDFTAIILGRRWFANQA